MKSGIINRVGCYKGNVYYYRPSTLPATDSASPQFSGRQDKSNKTYSGLNKPPSLKPGDTVAIVSPATPVSKKELEKDIRYIESMGFKVINYAKTDWHKKHYLSDTDKNRAEALNRAFRNPRVKAIFVNNGGGGTFRPDFLKYLDWENIRKNPKIITGYSDITFLHHALYKKGGMITFHSSFLDDSPDYKQNIEPFFSMVSPKNSANPPTPIKAGREYKCFVPGEATGELIGGNLCLLTSLIGTPYENDLKGKILFIEDWREDYETIDRLFSQLAHRGMWKKIRGLILGEFLEIPLNSKPYNLPKERFFKDLIIKAKQHGIPVGFNFPVGHGEKNHPMPLGIKVHFNSITGTLTFLESPVK